jgi:glucose/arabinose dehydrogenase
MRHLSVVPVAIAVLVAACSSATPPPAHSPDSGTAEAVSGRERMGWDQQAANAAQLGRFQYAAYVDGTRTGLADVNCAATAEPQIFACTSKLPALSPGTHVLELVTVLDGRESPRSAPLRISLNATTAVTAPVEWPDETVTPDGVTLRVERVLDGLQDPVDAAFTPDGRLFIAERQGRVRVLDSAMRESPGASSSAAESDASGDRLLSIAVDPDFDRTHWIYMVQATRTGDGDAFMVARYREVQGTLGERAVLIQAAGPPLADASAVLRMGPDRKLYLAVGAADFPGTLLRLNLDGTMPRDQSGTAPALAQGLQAPRGLSADPRSGMVWIGDEQNGEAHLSAVGIEGRPLRAVVRARYPMAGGSGPMVFYGGNMPGFENTLLLASEAGRHIERIRVSPAQPDRIASTETLLQDAVGPIQALAVSPDGAIYFCTAAALGKISLPSP